MPRLPARFRVSVKDHRPGRILRLELIEQPWPSRFLLRVDGRRVQRLPEASVTQVCDRLRRWLTQLQSPRKTRARPGCGLRGAAAALHSGA
jgi:hypothetical protein